MAQRATWKQAIETEQPLLLPCAHDALSARLIERAGFHGYSIGGFPLVGARHAMPDIGLASFGEMHAGVADILAACGLPVMVDADDGYGDAKNVHRTIHAYEQLGASAIFIEDQVAPKRCGHMSGKRIVAVEQMVAKVRAAAAARDNPDTFLLARTDARAVEGLDGALRRGERYLAAGADGIFIEAPQSVEELRLVGEHFDVPQLANMLEGGRTPLLSPADLRELGFAMVAYPTTLIFRVARTIERALADLQAGRLSLVGEGVGFDEFKSMVDFDRWRELEQRSEE